ncbi:MAG: hypothetical protein ACXWM6_13305 [Thermodesulfobacteriota bacterium]
MANTSRSGVVLKETFLKARRRGIFLFLLMALVYLMALVSTIAIAGLLTIITE